MRIPSALFGFKGEEYKYWRLIASQVASSVARLLSGGIFACALSRALRLRRYDRSAVCR